MGTSEASGDGDLTVVVLGAYERSNISLDVGFHQSRTLGAQLLVTVAFLPLAVVTLLLFLADMGDAGAAMAVLTGVTAVILLAAFVGLRSRRASILRHNDRLWCSSIPAAFVGPHDDSVGLPDVERFAKRHEGEAFVPMVWLALSRQGFELIPTSGRRRDVLQCKLEELASIDVVDQGRNRRGMTLYLWNGRRATLRVEPTEELLQTLRDLGAKVVAEPSASPDG